EITRHNDLGHVRSRDREDRLRERGPLGLITRGEPPHAACVHGLTYQELAAAIIDRLGRDPNVARRHIGKANSVLRSARARVAAAGPPEPCCVTRAGSPPTHGSSSRNRG